MRTNIVKVCILLQAFAVSAYASLDFSRYNVILERKPFGEPPAPPPAQVQPPVRQGPPAPSFVKDYKMVAITESKWGVKVGFIDIKSKPQKSYFLYEGESEDGIEVVEADYEAEAALLRKGSEQDWISMNGRAGGGAPPSAAGGATPEQMTAARRASYAERLRKRREAVRHRKVEPPKFTGEELKKHLEEIQMDAIRKGLPALPIPLTQEMDDQLVAEGVLPPQGQ